jgi:hypothetical protein
MGTRADWPAGGIRDVRYTLDLMAGLAALVPLLRMHLARFRGAAPRRIPVRSKWLVDRKLPSNIRACEMRHAAA